MHRSITCWIDGGASLRMYKLTWKDKEQTSLRGTKREFGSGQSGGAGAVVELRPSIHEGGSQSWSGEFVYWGS